MKAKSFSVWQLEEPPVKRAVDVPGIQDALGRLGGMRNRQDHRATDELGKGREQVIGDGGAPVLADDVGRSTAAEGPDQRGDVGHERAFVVEAVARDLTWRIASEVRRDGAIISRGQGPHLVTPRPRTVGEAVEEQNEWTVALLKIGELEPVRADAIQAALISHNRNRIGVRKRVVDINPVLGPIPRGGDGLTGHCLDAPIPLSF
jgi:hypothetical protein